MPARERGFTGGVQSLYHDCDYYLWDDISRVPDMPEHMKACFQQRVVEQEWAFAADILRIHLMATIGGVYLDIDVEARQKLPDTFWSYNLAVRHHGEGDKTITNDFMAFSVNNDLAAHLSNLIHHPEYAFGPHWFGYSIKDYIGVPRDEKHIIVKQTLARRNGLYIPNAEWAVEHGAIPWETYFYHHALFSWSDENKKKFKDGFYEAP